MIERSDIFVQGAWHASTSIDRIDVINPANGDIVGRVPAGSQDDVDAAVVAAHGAFPAWAALPLEDRLAPLSRLRDMIAGRSDEFASLITAQMGCPIGFSRAAQIGLPLRNFDVTLAAARAVSEERLGRSTVVREPVGVVAAITPWNFPLHQIVAKIVPALATGCTVVLKPSEITPLDAALLADLVAEAGFPDGVFNLIFGAGMIGASLVAHRLVDMVSFTGSTRAGRQIAEVAGRRLARVALELGGKSANVVLDDCDLSSVIGQVLGQCYVNAGQTCAALTRLIVPKISLAKAERLAVEHTRGWSVGDPLDPATKIGPLATRRQKERVIALLDKAITQGATVLSDGLLGRPGTAEGAYVPPTVLGGVTPEMSIAREEVFGPVLVIMGYADEDEAVALANGTDYGLSAGVWSGDLSRARMFARRLRTGQVVLNGATLDLEAPFGGVRQSGIGREYGRYGLEEFTTLKAITLPTAAVQTA